MSYKFNDENTRKYISNFTVNEWIMFRERLANLIANGELSERNARILTEIIVNQKTTAQLNYLAKNDPNYTWLQSNQCKPMSTRRIQQILTEYFPEFHIQETHKKERKNQKVRTEQLKLRETIITPDSACGKCGSQEQLEIHHILPVIIGGNNNDNNMIVLCAECHKYISSLFREWLRKNPEIKKLVETNIHDSDK